ncbi:hypothetical protein BaRGS_00013297, partial [Batillaria attramentaria]
TPLVIACPSQRLAESRVTLFLPYRISHSSGLYRAIGVILRARLQLDFNTNLLGRAVWTQRGTTLRKGRQPRRMCQGNSGKPGGEVWEVNVGLIFTS